MMEIPEGLVTDVDKKKVLCKLLKSWYGLKQSARCWNEKFKSVIKRLNLVQCQGDQCIFRGTLNGHEVLVAIFVDDGLVASRSNEAQKIVLNALSESFEIKLGDSCCFVGLQIERNRFEKSMFIHQKIYARKVIEKFCNKNEKSVTVPADPHSILVPVDDDVKLVENVLFREIVGSLMYLAIVSRPDLAFSLNVVSRFLNKHDESHWQALKRILKYLIGSIDFGILYQTCESDFCVSGFSDSDFAGDMDTRRSTSGFVFCLAGGAVTWASQRQKIVTLSTTEAEYVAAATASKEAVWLRKLMKDLGCSNGNPICLFVDNQSAIKLVKNPEYHKRTKHIDIKYHFIRERVQEGDLIIKYVSSHDQKADIFTKPFAKDRFLFLRESLGMFSKSQCTQARGLLKL